MIHDGSNGSPRLRRPGLFLDFLGCRTAGVCDCGCDGGCDSCGATAHHGPIHAAPSHGPITVTPAPAAMPQGEAIPAPMGTVKPTMYTTTSVQGGGLMRGLFRR